MNYLHFAPINAHCVPTGALVTQGGPCAHSPFLLPLSSLRLLLCSLPLPLGKSLSTYQNVSMFQKMSHQVISVTCPKWGFCAKNPHVFLFRLILKFLRKSRSYRDAQKLFERRLLFLSLPGHQKEVLGQFLFHACQGPRDKKVKLLLSIIATGFEFTSGLHFYNILLI